MSFHFIHFICIGYAVRTAQTSAAKTASRKKYVYKILNIN